MNILTPSAGASVLSLCVGEWVVWCDSRELAPISPEVTRGVVAAVWWSI